MSDNQNSNEKQKRRSTTPAQMAFVFALIAFLCRYFLSTLSIHRCRLLYTFLFGTVIFSGAAIVLGLVSLLGRRKQRSIMDKILAIFSIVAPAIMIILVLSPRLTIDHEPAPRIVCGSNLMGLGKAVHIYSQEDKGRKYPTPDKWCDLLIEYVEVSEKQFRCPGNKKERCSYAMNPNAEPNSPMDMVLLFESKGGWNQFGGAGLLSAENHQGKGCNILFNDRSARFVRKEELSELKWK